MQWYLALPDTSSVGVTGSPFNQTALNIVSFASRGGIQNWDEIRFGATYDDVIGAGVIPEPSTFALLGAGALLRLRPAQPPIRPDQRAASTA
jgi:hypothetical protein